MANYWAITIGINQYRHLQPLMHAQNDALFTHRFFTEEAGIAADHCVLLSDLTTSVGHQVVYPDKPAIAQWVQTITQQVEPDDVLWFFFSGYGSQVDGKDYLMPIDGDPGQIEGTGIAIADVIETLAQLPTDKILLILDINRSQGALSGQTIGTQVIDLAQSQQIPTLLSCQPEQYSHETLGVRHGLFTAAFLEAIQQDCTTPNQIHTYLTKRLPELCEHHWRPIQNPVGLIPEHAKMAVVVPRLRSADILTTDPTALSTSNTADSNTAASNTDETASSAGISTDQTSATGDEMVLEPPLPEMAAVAGTTAAVGAGASGLAANKETGLGLGSDGAGGTVSVSSESAAQQFPYTEETQATGSYRTAKSRRDQQIEENPAESSAIVPYQGDTSVQNGARLRNWGLLALAILMGGVLLKQPFVKTVWKGLTDKTEETAQQPAETAPTVADAESTEESTTPADAANDADPEEAGDVASTDEAKEESATETPEENESAAEDATASENADKKPTEKAEGADAETSDADASDNAAADAPAPASPEDQATAKAMMAQANAAIEQREYSEALIALQKVPNSQRDSAFSSLLTQARAGAAAVQQTNASVLTEARTFIQPTQASQFTEAIAKARLIKEGEPSYAEAQEDIRNWSRTILDIAEGRATSGNLEGAIAAASVMPYDNAEFRKKAQDRIVFWKQRQNSRNIIAQAQQIPKSGQASTYQKGIVKLREVPIEHPEYEAAQRRADEWSQRIFSIAQARAAQGRQSAAIQAAILVPAGTTAYEPTQQAIRRWRAEDSE